MDRLQLRDVDGAVELVRRWRSRYSLWPVAALASTSFLWLGAYARSGPAGGPFGWGGAVAMGALVVLTGYWSLATLANATVVRLEGRAVTARHGPVPTPVAAPAAVAGVARFEVGFRRVGQRDAQAYYQYQLVAKDAAGASTVLFEDRDRALTERAVALLSARLR